VGVERELGEIARSQGKAVALISELFCDEESSKGVWPGSTIAELANRGLQFD
jgi:hypothetical protein